MCVEFFYPPLPHSIFTKYSLHYQKDVCVSCMLSLVNLGCDNFDMLIEHVLGAILICLLPSLI